MKKLSLIFWGFVLSVVVCTASSKGIACRCFRQSACMEFNQASAVFVGKVVQASQTREETWNGKTETGYIGELLFDVIEPFSGITGRTISVWSNGYGCGSVAYRIGEVYLVYATESKDQKLQADPCVTYPLSQYLNVQNQPNEELTFLRNATSGKLEGARISGRIYADTSNLKKGEKPSTDYLPGTPVKIEGEQMSQIIMTDDEGAFEIKGLKPGKYSVTITKPKGYLYADAESSEQIVSLKNCGCGLAGFRLSLDSSIRGRALDSERKPIEGISVSLISAEWQDGPDADPEIESAPKREDVSGKNGEFKFDSVAPGRYLLVTNLFRLESKFPYPRTFYPQTTDIKKAAVITIDHDQNVGPFDLRLGNKIATQTIQGVVLWPDETPVEGASVRLTLPGDFQSQEETDTDEEGHFSLKALKDRDYEIKAYWHDDGVSGKVEKSPLGWKLANSEAERLTVTKDVKGLKLILTKRLR